MDTKLKTEVIGLIDERVDRLAIMVQAGFSEVLSKMATKDDLERFATKDDLNKIDERLSSVELKLEGHSRRFDYIDDNIRMIKTKVGI